MPLAESKRMDTAPRITSFMSSPIPGKRGTCARSPLPPRAALDSQRDNRVTCANQSPQLRHVQSETNRLSRNGLLVAGVDAGTAHDAGLLVKLAGLTGWIVDKVGQVFPGQDGSPRAKRGPE